MRLIDADKLMESLDPKESVWVGLALSELIANATTVEAIPVEFLKKQAQKAIGFSEGGNDSVSVKNGMLEVVSGYIFAQTIATIIEEWRNENGNTDKLE